MRSQVSISAQRPTKKILHHCCGLTLFLSASAAATEPVEYADLSIEELMNVTVTSVSKKAESLFDAAAAISVLNNEDLRRSGATTVADALRLVPGLDVASLDAGHWAVSARGFNNLYANKLLVLVDGRAVYTPLFAGVNWDQLQIMLDDVDRIEVIRGPGAAVWGANAMNGVINIVTRSAGETQGGLLSTSVGDPQRRMTAARFGGRIGGDTQFRAFASVREVADFALSNGDDAADGWHGARAGFRLDHAAAETQLTWQANASRSEFEDGQASSYNFNTIGRWTQQGERSTDETQIWFDRSLRDESDRARALVDTLDLSFQRTLDYDLRHQLIWGLGLRTIDVHLAAVTPLVQVRDDQLRVRVFSAFAQQQFKPLPEGLTLTAGLKLEHNDLTGFELQPSLRAVFEPTPRQTLWGAVSRAVRTPSLVEGADIVAITFGAPIAAADGRQYVPTLVGGDPIESEVLRAYELGYRLRPAERFSIDVASFYNRYGGLISFGAPRLLPGEPLGVAEMPWSNLLDGTTSGAEVVLTAAPHDAWRVTASYSLLHVELRGSTDEDRRNRERSAPNQQFGLRSSFDFSDHASLDTQLRYVGEIEGVRAWLEADIRLSWRPTEQLELALVGQNLLHGQHPEQLPANFTLGTEVPRGGYARIDWRF